MPPKVDEAVLKYRLDRRDQYRLRYRASWALKGLDFRGRPHRTCVCGSKQVSQDDVGLYRSESGHLGYRGLSTCGNPWTCAVCARIVSAQRTEEVKCVLMRYFSAKNSEGYKIYSLGMLTLTRRHNNKNKCAYLRKSVLITLKLLRQDRDFRRWQKEIGIVGDVRSLEITFGFANGFHPHLHLILVAACSPEALEAFALRVQAKWISLLKKSAQIDGQHYRPIITEKDVVEASDYVGKAGDQHTTSTISPSTGPDGITCGKAAAELVRGAFKKNGMTPFGMLRRISEEIAEAKIAGCAPGPKVILLRNKFREFADAFHGTKQLTWSVSFSAVRGEEKGKGENKRKEKGEEMREAREAEEAAQAPLRVLSFSPLLWPEISRRHLQLPILERMEYGEGIDAVRRLLLNSAVPVLTSYRDDIRFLDLFVPCAVQFPDAVLSPSPLPAPSPSPSRPLKPLVRVVIPNSWLPDLSDLTESVRVLWDILARKKAELGSPVFFHRNYAVNAIEYKPFSDRDQSVCLPCLAFAKK